MRVRRQLIDAVDAGGRNIQALAQRQTFGAAHFPCDAHHVGIQFGHPRVALDAVVQIVFGCQVGAADAGEQRFPVVCGVGQHRHVAVARGGRFAATGQDARVARLRGGRLECEAAQMLGQGEGHHGFKHRHFHILSLAAALAVKQRGQHSVDQRQPGGLVGHQGGRKIGRRALMADQGRHAAGGLDHVIECRTIGIRPLLAEAGGHAVNDFRVERCHCRIAQAEALDRRHAHVVHQHVNTGEQLLERVQAGRGLEVDRKRALVAVECEKDRTHAAVARHAVGAHQVALQGLHLDHIGAEIAQDLRGQGPQYHRSQVEHAYTAQGAGWWRCTGWMAGGGHGVGVRCNGASGKAQPRESTGRLA